MASDKKKRPLSLRSLRGAPWHRTKLGRMKKATSLAVALGNAAVSA